MHVFKRITLILWCCYLLPAVMMLLIGRAPEAVASAYGFPTVTANTSVGSSDTGFQPLFKQVTGGDTTISGANNYTPACVNDVGTLKVAPETPRKATYICDSGAFTCASSATDVSQIYSGGSKVVKIQRVEIEAYDAGAGGVNNTILLIRRSSANSGGTAATDTICPMDPNDSGANAVVKHYTGNPSSLGSSVATIVTARSISSSDGFSAVPCKIVLFDATQYGKPIMLRASTDGLCINLNSTTQTGTSPKFIARYIWTEE